MDTLYEIIFGGALLYGGAPQFFIGDKDLNLDVEEQIKVCCQHKNGCNNTPIWRLEFWNSKKDPEVDPISAVGVCNDHLELVQEIMAGVQKIAKDGCGEYRVVPNNTDNRPKFNKNISDFTNGAIKEI